METNTGIKYFSKEYWKTHWKFILINVSIFIGIFLVLLGIDLITKETIFRWEDKQKLIVDTNYQSGNKFIIFKSILHKGTTIGIFETNLGFLHTISFLIFLGSLWGTTFIKDKKLIYITVFLAIISAGSFGNMVDRFLFKGVRDIINFPWINDGVFNVADVWLVLGSIGIFLSVVIESLRNYIKQKKDKQITHDSNIEFVSREDKEITSLETKESESNSNKENKDIEFIENNETKNNL